MATGSCRSIISSRKGRLYGRLSRVYSLFGEVPDFKASKYMISNGRAPWAFQLPGEVSSGNSWPTAAIARRNTGAELDLKQDVGCVEVGGWLEVAEVPKHEVALLLGAGWVRKLDFGAFLSWLRPQGSMQFKLRTIFEALSPLASLPAWQEIKMPWSWPVDVNYHEVTAET